MSACDSTYPYRSYFFSDFIAGPQSLGGRIFPSQPENRRRQAMTAARFQLSNAPVDFTRSRNRNFWILPVDVFGIAPNTTALGVLKPGSCSRQ